MAEQLRWGILGTGNIAHQFVQGVRGIAEPHRSILAAVGSRAQATASDFADQYDIPTAHASYEALIKDDQVQGVYVSLPNHLHHAWTIKALQAGKHVLCEKPLSVNAKQANEMFDCAQQHDRVLMEAFMYRCHPLTHAVIQAIEQGVIGQVRLIQTSFCYRTRYIEGNTRFSVDLAGGALMDIGCYCVNFSRMIAKGEPTAVHAVGTLHASGVDENVAGTLTFDDGVLAHFACGMGVQTNNTARICGTEGYLEVPVPWKPPTDQAIYVVDGMTPPRQEATHDAKPSRQTFHVDADMPLYGLEAEHFADVVLDGKPTPLTRQDSVGNMLVLDQLRQQVGLPF